MVEQFKIIPLSTLLKVFNNKGVLDKAHSLLSTFKCEKNLDEQNFLHHQAIDFENLNKARTYLIFFNKELIAYFSLSFKSIEFENISKSKKKLMTAGEVNAKTYSGYLIGHIAKSDNTEYKVGSFIIDSAFDIFLKAQGLVGGRLAYLDCRDNEHLKKLYENLGFTYFQTSLKTGLLQYYKKL